MGRSLHCQYSTVSSPLNADATMSTFGPDGILHYEDARTLIREDIAIASTGAGSKHPPFAGRGRHVAGVNRCAFAKAGHARVAFDATRSFDRTATGKVYAQDPIALGVGN